MPSPSGPARERRGRGPRRREQENRDTEFEQRTLELSRVSRVVAGGKRMRFRALIVVGDMKGRVGIGLGKGTDVSSAISKASTQAKKHLVVVPIVEETIPHEIRQKFSAAYVLLKPAPLGSGVIAGGAVRVILQLAGVKNVISKMLGSRNKVNNAYAVIEALRHLTPRSAKQAAPAPAKEEQPA